MAIPNLSLQTSSTSGAKGGDLNLANTFNGGEMTFGGSGSGGAVGGGLVGGLLAKYWPVLAIGGAIWWYRKKSQ